MSDDPVIDFLITEAVAIKVAQENEELEKQNKREQWKQQVDDLRQRVASATA